MNRHTPDQQTIQAALGLACRAPSLHNSQPWRWLVAEHTVHLYADRSRLLRATDQTGRELVISCGAALHHAQVAFASLGWRAFAHHLPNPAEPDHLAALEFILMRPESDQMVELAAAISNRHTDRRPFLPGPIPPPVLQRLRAAAELEHAKLTVVDTDSQRCELVVAMTAVNAAQRNNPDYQAELARWAGRLGAVDGVPAGALRAAGGSARPQLARDFSAAGPGDLTAPPVDDGATLAVLSTRLDDPRSWLSAGEALSAILLTATTAGLASCVLSQIAEYDLARQAVRSAVLGGSGEPQLLLRLGWPVTLEYPARRSPRRPLTDVMEQLTLD